MSIGTRFGSVALLVSALAFPALAQNEPSGGWTDPPIRGSAVPQTPSAPEDSTAKPAADAPPTPSKQSASAPKSTAPAADVRDAAGKARVAEARPARRSAGTRRAHIRRVAARSRAVAEVPETRAARRRETADRGDTLRTTRLAARSRHRSVPRVAARRMPEPVYRGSYAWRYAPPAYENEAGPYRRAYAPRMAGWGGLAGGRTSRIAQAQAAGYIVMRSRTYEYPDGTQFRSYRPLGYEDLD